MNNRRSTKGRNIQYIQECLRDVKGQLIIDKSGHKTYINKTKKVVHH